MEPPEKVSAHIKFSPPKTPKLVLLTRSSVADELLNPANFNKQITTPMDYIDDMDSQSDV